MDKKKLVERKLQLILLSMPEPWLNAEDLRYGCGRTITKKYERVNLKKDGLGCDRYAHAKSL